MSLPEQNGNPENGNPDASLKQTLVIKDNALSILPGDTITGNVTVNKIMHVSNAGKQCHWNKVTLLGRN